MKNGFYDVATWMDNKEKGDRKWNFGKPAMGVIVEK